MHRYENATITVNGEPLEAESISLQRACEPPTWGRPLVVADTFRSEVNCTMLVARATVEDLLRAFGPLYPPGASVDTLWRRVWYGGRKGRSALRRLRAARVLE